MNIIVLAAGMGTRLGGVTNSIPKCMVEVNGKKIVDNLLENLKIFEPDKVVFVTGHLENILKEYIVENWQGSYDFEFIYNEDYNKTNNIYSLWLARDFMLDNYLIVESDVFFESSVFPEKLGKNNLWFSSEFEDGMDGCALTVNENAKINKIEIIRGERPKEVAYKSAGIVYIGKDQKHLLNLLEKDIRNGEVNKYYDLFFAKYISSIEIFINDLGNKKWFEIDDQADLLKASRLFDMR